MGGSDDKISEVPAKSNGIRRGDFEVGRRGLWRLCDTETAGWCGVWDD